MMWDLGFPEHSMGNQKDIKAKIKVKSENDQRQFEVSQDAGAWIWLCLVGRVLWRESRDSRKAILLGFKAGDVAEELEKKTTRRSGTWDKIPEERKQWARSLWKLRKHLKWGLDAVCSMLKALSLRSGLQLITNSTTTSSKSLSRKLKGWKAIFLKWSFRILPVMGKKLSLKMLTSFDVWTNNLRKTASFLPRTITSGIWSKGLLLKISYLLTMGAFRHTGYFGIILMWPGWVQTLLRATPFIRISPGVFLLLPARWNWWKRWLFVFFFQKEKSLFFTLWEVNWMLLFKQLRARQRVQAME